MEKETFYIIVPRDYYMQVDLIAYTTNPQHAKMYIRQYMDTDPVIIQCEAESITDPIIQDTLADADIGDYTDDVLDEDDRIIFEYIDPFRDSEKDNRPHYDVFFFTPRQLAMIDEMGETVCYHADRLFRSYLFIRTLFRYVKLDEFEPVFRFLFRKYILRVYILASGNGCLSEEELEQIGCNSMSNVLEYVNYYYEAMLIIRYMDF